MMKLDDSVDTTVAYPDFPTTSFTVKQQIKTTYLITFRGRLGVAAGPALIYGTAGIAIVDLDNESTFTDTFSPVLETGSIKETPKKFVYGGGAEFRLGHHASIKGEFLHADFGTFETTSTNLVLGGGQLRPQNVFTHTTTFVLNVIRFGVNFGF
jgi:outer membrane immunogenic protein